MESTNWADLKNIDKSLYKSGISLEESQKLYSQWAKAETYDKMMNLEPENYSCLYKLTSVMEQLYTRNREQVKILDVGAGSGLTNLYLQGAGFKCIDGLEPNEEFVKIIKGKGIYQNIIQSFIGGEKPVDVPDDTYDAVVLSGALGPGHIPCSGIPEMVRVAKSGGYLVFVMREEYLWTVPEYKGRLERLLNKLEADRKIRRILCERYPNHYIHYDGICHAYIVL